MSPASTQTGPGPLGEMGTAPLGEGTRGLSCQEYQKAEADIQREEEKGLSPLKSIFPIWFTRLILFPRGFIFFHLSKMVSPMFSRSFLQSFYNIPGDI